MLPGTGDLRQPDGRSCGAAVAVAHRMLSDPRFAARIGDRFGEEVLRTHRRLVGWRTATGSVQPPWPRALGTPPWALARELTARTGRRHRVRWIPPWHRARALAGVRAAVAAGPVALYVGSRWLPRHVVLVLDAQLHAYDPAVGGVVPLDPVRFAAGRLPLRRWAQPWFWIGG